MRVVLSAALLLALVLAGCADAPEAERVTPSAPSEGNGSSEGPTDEDEAERLVDGENADLRMRLTSHLANETTTRVVTSVLNKRTDDIVLNYAILDTADGGDFFFQLDARIPAGAERTVSAEDSTGDTNDRRAPWTQLTFYYTVAFGTEGASDAAAAFDLRGRGLPT